MIVTPGRAAAGRTGRHGAGAVAENLCLIHRHEGEVAGEREGGEREKDNEKEGGRD